MIGPTCPLCAGANTYFLHRSDDRHGVREFYRCVECDLISVPAEYHLPAEAEFERYRLHNNDPDDPDYRRFLSRLWDVFRPRLQAGALGLEFGCGPGPALAKMIGEDGLDVRLYDPYFYPDRSVLELSYDFITTTETVEHLRQPRETFELLDWLLVPGGQLGIMTGIVNDRTDFKEWYYQRDPTHIVFYSPRTMRWIGEKFGWTTDFPLENVVVFAKPLANRTP